MKLFVSVGLGALTVAALIIRLLGIDFGRPYMYHADEWVVMNPAMEMTRTGDWNPHSFLYPSALIYAERVVVTAIHQATQAHLDTDVGIGLSGLPERAASDDLPEQFDYALGGRVLVATMGALTTILVFLAGRHVISLVGALAASAIIGLAPLHVVHSHFLTTDVPVTMFTALALWLAFAGRHRGSRWLVAAGFAAGLAASTKYNGGIVLVAPLVVQLSSITQPRDILGRAFLRRTGAIVVASMAGFAAATPAVIFDTKSVIDAVGLQLTVYSSGHPGAEGSSNWLYYLMTLFSSDLGPPFFALVVLGLLVSITRRRAVDYAVLAFVGVYFAVVSIQFVRFDRNLLPLFPFLALLGGQAVDLLVAGIHATNRMVGRVPAISVTLAIAGLLTLAFLNALTYAFNYGQYLKATDTRTAALEWIYANLPAHTSIVREDYTPQILPDEYHVGYVWLLPSHSIEWYRAAGASYLVASSAQFDRFDGYLHESAFYRELFLLPIVYDQASGGTFMGPRIVIVRITP